MTIEYIDRGNAMEADLAYFSDGRVGILGEAGSTNVKLAEEALEQNLQVNVSLNKDSKVMKLQLIKSEEIAPDSETKITPFQSEYQPTILPNMTSVSSIFKRMNRSWQRDSQCYNRAHVWNYEEFAKTGLLSKKVFIFYTRRYIRNYNFYWWFHAIPTVLAQSEGQIVERALDPMFAKSPLPMKAWTDIFIKSRRTCPVITKYSTYRNNQETEDCYLHFASMYFWQPRDLEKLEQTGFAKTNFIRSEIDHSYWEAF